MAFLEVLTTPDEILPVQEMILEERHFFYHVVVLSLRVPRLLECVASASVVSPWVKHPTLR